MGHGENREMVKNLKGQGVEDHEKGEAVGHQKVRLHTFFLSVISCLPAIVFLTCINFVTVDYRLQVTLAEIGWCLQMLWDRALEVRIALQKMVQGANQMPGVGLPIIVHAFMDIEMYQLPMQNVVQRSIWQWHSMLFLCSRYLGWWGQFCILACSDILGCTLSTWLLVNSPLFPEMWQKIQDMEFCVIVCPKFWADSCIFIYTHHQ